MRVGIVGYGTVGHHLERTFAEASIETRIYDKNIPLLNSDGSRTLVNQCDAVFVAVPTPASVSGACDISAVEDAVSWIRPPICLKSTVPPGTTDQLVEITGKAIVCSPEYIGETPFHRYKNPSEMVDLVVVGGKTSTCRIFQHIYKMVYGPYPRYFLTTAIEAELAKYMENCFFAMKVAFVAQFYDLAEQFGADFDQVREIWVADSRIGTSHSIIVDKPGFGGSCLPKDLAAMISAADSLRGAPLLEAIMSFNTFIRSPIPHRRKGNNINSHEHQNGATSQ